MSTAARGGVAKTRSQTVELRGYADQLSVEPGETLNFMVSASASRVRAEVVRLRHGDENPNGPGFSEQAVHDIAEFTFPGRLQSTAPGSAIVLPLPEFASGSLTVGVYVAPTIPAQTGDWQGVVSRRAGDAGFSLALNAAGRLSLRVGGASGQNEIQTSVTLAVDEWHACVIWIDGPGSRFGLAVRELSPWPGRLDEVVEGEFDGSASCAAHFVVAGDGIGAGDEVGRTISGRFNGRLADLVIYDSVLAMDAVRAFLAGACRSAFPPQLGLEPVVALDFSTAIGGICVEDCSGNGHHGRLVNLPMAAVSGPFWDRRTLDPAQDAVSFRALRFHDDALEDAGWAADCSVTIPRNLASGIYALRLRTEVAEDHIPFVVRPAAGRPRSDVVLVLPTLTYLAYANERLVFSEDLMGALFDDGEDFNADAADHELRRHPEWGLSVYDRHRDGTGNVYSSARRPILNLRPRYRFWSTGAPERFAADLYIVDWLESQGIAFDVVSDHDVHEHGHVLLDHYSVALTGSHPEYVTEAILDAIEGYVCSGGRLMYLGGNGFYWVTSIDPHRPWLIEVRRGVNGTRAWTPTAGEYFHATTGEPGGLWRYRGRSPNRLTGVGFAAQADSSSPAAGYVRTSLDSSDEWIFHGVDDRVIGDFGLVNHGAAGYEIDRADDRFGTPPGARVLASSRGQHSDAYLLAVEDLDFSEHGLGGTQNEDVRSDVVLLPYDGGGAVFSVGSINWAGALSWNDYDNSISRITRNVIERFKDGQPL